MATAFIVGTWVQIVTGNTYDGMIGPIDWIDYQRSDVFPYGVDLGEGNTLFFSKEELQALPGKPEGDPRLTRLIVLEETPYLLVALDEVDLDTQEQELREASRLC